LRHRATCLLH